MEHYTLYLDGSGDNGWPPPYGSSVTKYYVVGGLAVSTDLDRKFQQSVPQILEKYFGFGCCSIHNVELRYTQLIAGKGEYEKIPGENRKQLADEIMCLIQTEKPILFGTVVNKLKMKERYGANAYDPNGYSIRSTIERFDKFLKRVDAQGTIIMDEEEKKNDRRLKRIIHQARLMGIKFGKYSTHDSKLENITGTINFSDSKFTYGIQLADYISHIIWRCSERKQCNRYDEITNLFDRYGLHPSQRDPSFIPR